MLYINGNGGFVGQYFNKNFLQNLIIQNEKISFYFLILLIISLFLLSINFSLKKFTNFLKKVFNFFNKKDNKNYTDKSELIDQYIPQDEIKNLIQEDLPFIKAEKIADNEKKKFKLPSADLLKLPTKKERENFSKNETQDPKFLEKILMDFGVSGNIKKG